MDIGGPTHPETIEEVEEHPRDDDVVVEGHEQRHNAGGDADAAQPGVDGVPDPQGAQSHSLADAQFDEEEGYTLQYQHNHEGYQERTCKGEYH